MANFFYYKIPEVLLYVKKRADYVVRNSDETISCLPFNNIVDFVVGAWKDIAAQTIKNCFCIRVLTSRFSVHSRSAIKKICKKRKNKLGHLITLQIC